MTNAPSRLSANGEHGFPKAPNGNIVRVTIDGDSRRAVIAFDINEGWVESICVDDKGAPLLRNGNTVCKREYGKVQAFIL